MRMKTTAAQRKANENYIKKYDSIMVRCEQGTKEKIQQLTGKSANAYIKDLIENDLKRLENK